MPFGVLGDGGGTVYPFIFFANAEGECEGSVVGGDGVIIDLPVAQRDFHGEVEEDVVAIVPGAVNAEVFAVLELCVNLGSVDAGCGRICPRGYSEIEGELNVFFGV